MADKRWALIANGLVVGFEMLRDDWMPGVDMYSPAMATNMVDVSNQAGIEPGWIYTNGTFAAPVFAASPPPRVAELLQMASSVQNAILSAIWAFNMGTGAAPLWVTTSLDGAGQLSMIKLILWAQLNAGTAGATEAYSNVDFSSLDLTPAQAARVGTMAGQAVSQSYATLNTLSQGILATPPTITSADQIRSAAWPVPASPTAS